MRYLSATDLADLLPPATLVAAIEGALRDYSCGKVTVPHRQHIDFGGNTLLVMPVMGSEVFGTKIVSVVPANAGRDLLVTNGLMILGDASSGQPLAVLNAAALTAQRTAAVGALALKYTTAPDLDRIGIVGVGVQGTWQAIFACAVRPIRTVHFLARSNHTASRFADLVARHVPSMRVERCGDVRDLLARSKAVIAATTSQVPVLPDDPKLLKDKHFVSVGSFKPSMQELPDSIYELAGLVIIDSEAARTEVGDLTGPLSKGLLRANDVVHVADVVSGNVSIDTARTTVFKSVGLGLYDLCAARAFLTEAERTGRGTPLPI
jgi:ornithine cyclodeaminase/alanine dehydrogenase-like protein (mu-crystallin family)